MGSYSSVMRILPHILLTLLCCFFSTAASADLVDQVNALRGKGCDSSQGVRAKLRSSADLDKVAREWSKGGRLHAAIERTGYRATNSASMRVQGAANDAQLLRTLAANYCDNITDPSFTDIGVYRTKAQTWIVLAAPLALPTIRDATAIGDKVLALVNDARSKPRRCGSKSYPSAPPLTKSAMLTQAALQHAQDMAAKNFFDHEGSDGNLPSQRVTKTGYEWGAVAENIAAGATTPEQVVNGWLDSPGHCTNIMGPMYTQMGIAYAVNPQSSGGIYWAQDFAAPR